MTRIWGRGREIMGASLELAIDQEKIHGAHLDITNFDEYILATKPSGLPIHSFIDPDLFRLTQNEIAETQWRLIKNQLHFAYSTTPATKYLWSIYGIHPDEINHWSDYRSKVLPITKEHQRTFGWMNFLPGPIAEYVLEGSGDINSVNPNLHIEQRKWTGGTSARLGKDYVYIIIPRADWRASVQTMVRIAEPFKDILRQNQYAGTTYDRRHIAEPIFEDQLRHFGVHLLAKPAGASDVAFFDILRENQIKILVAPPLDHPAKGQGIPGALKNIADQLEVVLMSSATPTNETVQTLIDHQIGVLNVGGDTGSLPTYYCAVRPDEDRRNNIQEITNLKIIKLAPALTEIVNPRNLTPANLNTWGVLLQTNCAAVWENGQYVQNNGQRVWIPDGTTCLVPALKTQMIRSSATGNLVYVTRVDENNIPTAFNHLILRYNDFELDSQYKPLLDFPRSSGGSATGGCAA